MAYIWGHAKDDTAEDTEAIQAQLNQIAVYPLSAFGGVPVTPRIIAEIERVRRDPRGDGLAARDRELARAA